MDTPTILKFSHYSPTCLWRWNRQCVPKRRYIKFRRRGITQKKTYNIQNTAKVWNQELFLFIFIINSPTRKSQIYIRTARLPQNLASAKYETRCKAYPYYVAEHMYEFFIIYIINASVQRYTSLVTDKWPTIVWFNVSTLVSFADGNLNTHEV